jgi:V8-like Glu-specific endopeptidase
MGGGFLKKVSDSGVAPYSGIGLVRAVWDDGTHMGSACLLDSKHFLTCAHNVIARGGGSHASDVYFHPRWNANGWPANGGIHVITCYRPDQFVKGDQSWDVAVGVLSEAVPSPDSGAFYFTREVTAEAQDLPEEVEISGYPGDGNGYLYTDTERVVGAAPDLNAISYIVTTDPGSSGSPVFVYSSAYRVARLYAVHVKKYQEQAGIGILITKAINDWIDAALSQHLGKPGVIAV